MQLPKALAPAAFNLCLGTVDRWVPEGYPARGRRAGGRERVATTRPHTGGAKSAQGCRHGAGAMEQAGEAGRGSGGSGLVQVAAKPHQLHAGLGERG